MKKQGQDDFTSSMFITATVIIIISKCHYVVYFDFKVKLSFC